MLSQDRTLTVRDRPIRPFYWIVNLVGAPMADIIRFSCPQCHKRLKAARVHRGRAKVTCPKCNRTLLVPAPHDIVETTEESAKSPELSHLNDGGPAAGSDSVREANSADSPFYQNVIDTASATVNWQTDDFNRRYFVIGGILLIGVVVCFGVALTFMFDNGGNRRADSSESESKARGQKPTETEPNLESVGRRADELAKEMKAAIADAESPVPWTGKRLSAGGRRKQSSSFWLKED